MRQIGSQLGLNDAQTAAALSALGTATLTFSSGCRYDPPPFDPRDIAREDVGAVLVRRRVRQTVPPEVHRGDMALRCEPPRFFQNVRPLGVGEL